MGIGHLVMVIHGIANDFRFGKIRWSFIGAGGIGAGAVPTDASTATDIRLDWSPTTKAFGFYEKKGIIFSV